MKRERRVSLPWLALGAVVICAWCSMLSAVGGWITGRDLARREASAEIATMTSSQDLLPPLGVLVTRMDRYGAAARAGISRGDVIVAINDMHVQDARDLRESLEKYHPGEVVRLGLLRDRGEEELSVQLDPFPGDARKPYLGVYYTARAEEPADL